MFENIFLVLVLCVVNSFGSMEEQFALDLNDILDENLMPGSLLLLEGPRDVKNNATLFKNITDIVTDDGSLNLAFSTMGFHRKMINEYLCSNFIAQQIMEELVPKNIMQRRMGAGPIADAKDNKDSMLYDPGSSGYQNWLAKTTTLEDIYKHYAFNLPVPDATAHSHSSAIKSTNKNPMNTSSISSRQDFIGNVAEDEYEEGAVTGYAYQQPMNTVNEMEKEMTMAHERFSHSNRQLDQMPSAGSKTDYHHQPSNPDDYRFQESISFEQNPYLYTTYHQHSPQLTLPVSDSKKNHLLQGEGHYSLDHEHEEYYAPAVHHSSHGGGGGGDKKALGLKDLFDIALTTLAFLSFGMFILQVLMCITMTKTNNNMMMMPTTGDGGDEVNEEIRRSKRAIPEFPTISHINDISKMVLKSIEAVLVAKKDDGQCLQRVICENNKFARKRKDNQKMWFPILGLGLSWLSSKIVASKSIFDNLRASMVGLGNGDCVHTYNSCNFTIQHTERLLRRKKRKVDNYSFNWTI